MTQVNLAEAKSQLASLLARAQSGEQIVIADGGQPVARLVPIRPADKPRMPGSAKGKIKIHDSFYAPLPEEIQRGFEGKSS
jgi:prevent-host-death family protein